MSVPVKADNFSIIRADELRDFAHRFRRLAGSLPRGGFQQFKNFFRFKLQQEPLD